MPLRRQRQAVATGSVLPSLRLLPLLALTSAQMLDPQAECMASPSLLAIATSMQRVALPDNPERLKASPPPAGLIALTSSRSGGGSSSSGATKGHGTNLLARSKEVPASWFGNFAKDESTFDPDGVGDHPDYPERKAARVSEVGNTVNMAGQENPAYMTEEGLPQDWFEESASGGPSAAWRTVFPPLEAFRGDGMKTVPWLPQKSGRSGRRKSTYSPSAVASIARAFDITKKKDAEWFDDSIRHYDDFGRERPPSERSDRFYWDWQRKSWSVPFGCQQPGCIASATLKTFDPKALQHAKCQISVGVHATDFDDEYSRENVEWITVNGARVSTRCDPMGRGCNKSVATKDRGLHPCVSDYPLDQLLLNGTDVNITGKISEMVDECPVDNNLLSGVARVTCWVKPWPTRPPPGSPVIPGSGNGTNCSTLLQCSEHGCSANISAPVCRQRPATRNERCTMTMRIWQTDFDGGQGSKEVVEWVKVNGKVVESNLNPGRNPCQEVYDGKAPTTASLAARNGINIAEEPFSLDAQSAGLLAPVPGDMQTAISCRRRVSGQLQANSLLNDSEERRNRKLRDIKHLRAAPDDMKTIITAKDVTEAVRLSPSAVLVGAKISDRVDECAKDGYLLNAEVSVECK